MFPWEEPNAVAAFQSTFHTPSAHDSLMCVHTETPDCSSVCASGMNPSYLCTEHAMVLHICTSALVFFVSISGTWQIRPPSLLFIVFVECFSHEGMDPTVLRSSPPCHVELVPEVDVVQTKLFPSFLVATQTPTEAIRLNLAHYKYVFRGT